MITPEFIGQVYVNSLNGDVWQSNSLTPGDWTKIGGSGGGSNIDGVGDPTGVVTPLYTGQYYRDTANGNIWKSTGGTNADWTLQVQDYGLQWTPLTEKLQDLFYLASGNYYGNDTKITSITVNAIQLRGLTVYYQQSLTSINAPNLISIDLLEEDGGYIGISDCPLLTSVGFPLLDSVPGGIAIGFCNSLASISYPSLTDSQHLKGRSNPSLTTVSAPNLILRNQSADALTAIDFPGCALNVESVNHLLARAVASVGLTVGTIDLSGGTSAAPDGQGIIDAGILSARGLTVTTN